ncbi:MAG TPA: DUF308 domain-containing protein [Ktedonobacterales bacterium]|nr:DUF308 domain-containing protein [Ktedonobacterales bacterium]
MRLVYAAGEPVTLAGRGDNGVEAAPGSRLAIVAGSAFGHQIDRHRHRNETRKAMDTPMDTSMDTSAPVQTAESKQMAMELAKWWWAWLVAGIVWILASIVILQFHHASVTLVGIVIGIMFLVAGLQEFVVAAVTDSWRWLWIAFGVLLVIGGIYALFNPVGTFLAIADTLGFLLALVGIFWIIEAFATMASNSLWWLGLISGFIMVLLGFWAGGQFLATQAYALLVFAGIWALFHGISDIFKAFAIRKVGAMVAA